MKTILFAAGLALSYLVFRELKARRRQCTEELLDQSLEDSFPASDPPSHTGTHI